MDIANMMIDKEMTIIAALKKIDTSARKILFVVDESMALIATLTDGDIRRWILKNGDLNAPVKTIMNREPKYLMSNEEYRAKDVMQQYLITALPIVDEKKVVIRVVFWNDEMGEHIKNSRTIDNPVVIMAGGKGTRLYPYTKILPKPLIPIGDTPIIERIINNFNKFGCKDFHLTVNYRKNMIKSYFSEVDKNYNVFYVEEEKPLGTGGSLSLLKDTIRETFFVSNCDVLIDADYADILDFHKKQENKITIVSSLKNITIPYGVIKLNNDGSMKGSTEKPEFNYLINTGMYILEPEVLFDVPEDTFYDLPTLAEDYIKIGKRVGVYPVSDKSWLDMGQIEEMENMLNALGVQ
ncbi:nucleotidyltransferase family protein [Clostridium cellulovorans]|uniref:Nucleotidyl transferase n=1 Tax=Clostridium cellulovorans (strain ATCC 35296 / DSM 3052 / OCM 3 / 743B) TaxID=573061 RepID=D9SPW9_CLOC7|nr:nucleotidyltransferase family protein [Clostridium cellulovorans]ADL52105.1 Nucleotidyl transferase [Clostridium cellulovorans 743B]